MFSRGKRTLLLAAACVSLAILVFVAIQRYRYRFVHSDSDLFKLLPQAQATLFFADVSALRRSGYLRLLEGTKPHEDKDYTDFVRETGFDYSKDIDAIAGASKAGQVLFCVRGRFQSRKLEAYAAGHHGSCGNGVCDFPTSTPGQTASFRFVQPDVIALAVGPAGQAVQVTASNDAAPVPSSAPVWVKPATALLRNPAELPLALRIFAISLQSAESLVVSLRPSHNDGSAFDIVAEAAFQNASAAGTAKVQLALATSALKLELAKERRQADPADLAWLLTSGSFEATGARLTGMWPVRKELLHSLQ